MRVCVVEYATFSARTILFHTQHVYFAFRGNQNTAGKSLLLCHARNWFKKFTQCLIITAHTHTHTRTHSNTVQFPVEINTSTEIKSCIEVVQSYNKYFSYIGCYPRCIFSAKRNCAIHVRVDCSLFVHHSSHQTNYGYF